ncbi:MAG: hypothetical protein KDH84_20565, partial [Calditrichaeota bacterium]|nr:hypothetical protein [Calditrichota bacterium]
MLLNLNATDRHILNLNKLPMNIVPAFTPNVGLTILQRLSAIVKLSAGPFAAEGDIENHFHIGKGAASAPGA